MGFDLGGHTVARKVWSEYFQQVDAVVYMVDTVDRERFSESKAELDGLLGTEGLTDVPFLILANKIDVPQAASEEEIRGALGLHNMTTGKVKPPQARLDAAGQSAAVMRSLTTPTLCSRALVL